MDDQQQQQQHNRTIAVELRWMPVGNFGTPVNAPRVGLNFVPRPRMG